MGGYVNSNYVITIAAMAATIFYKTEEAFERFHARLKLEACPHCRRCGCLILHGYLEAYDDVHSHPVRRGRRIFCSNRNQKNGCGRTFAILMTGFIYRFRVSAAALWRFLENIKKGKSKLQAFVHAGSDLAPANCYRLYQRFRQNQSRIRPCLSRIKAPPPVRETADPVVQTVCHLKSIFKDNLCPVAQFQYVFQASFL